MEPISRPLNHEADRTGYRIGARLRQLREEKGISLRALAQATGLTPSFLSQVERDLAEPSIKSLRQIAQALEVPLFLLFLDTAEYNPVVPRSARRIIRFPGSKLTYQLLVPDLNRQMEAILTTIGPGGATSDAPISHEGEEWTMILSGRATVLVADQEYTLEEGDCIYYYATLPHLIRNPGPEELLVVSVMTPPKF